MSEKVNRTIRQYNRMVNAPYKMKSYLKAYRQLSWKEKTKFNKELKENYENIQ